MNGLQAIAKRNGDSLDVSLFYRQADGNYSFLLPDGNYQEIKRYVSENPVFVSLTPDDILSWRKHG